MIISASLAGHLVSPKIHLPSCCPVHLSSVVLGGPTHSVSLLDLEGAISNSLGSPGPGGKSSEAQSWGDWGTAAGQWMAPHWALPREVGPHKMPSFSLGRLESRPSGRHSCSQQMQQYTIPSVKPQKPRARAPWSHCAQAGPKAYGEVASWEEDLEHSGKQRVCTSKSL